jgi:hypothetical protein
MKITANIATYPPRQEQLKKMLPTILEQFDEVRICLNQYEAIPQFLNHPKIKPLIPTTNLTDNGKFAFVALAEKDEIYCTLDDDILYPSDYTKVIKDRLERYPNHVITFHGRKLKGKFKNYYTAGHDTYRCLSPVLKDTIIDVCGSGVSAFVPFDGIINVAKSSHQRMSDVVFSLHCAFMKVPIIVCAHRGNWIKHIESDVSIYEEEKDSDFPQAILSAKIYELNNSK